MDIDRSVNGWFERIRLIQRKADCYKLQQDILSSLSDNDGLDFYVKSKGIVIGANTCILRCRCPRFYHEVVKKLDISSLPVHLLESVSDFIKCVYSEDDITAYENKLIKSINVDQFNEKKRPSIDFYEPKRISCDINPLYYSLAQYDDDFSSSEFGDFEQCTYDEPEILNQAFIDSHLIGNMDINSNNSVECCSIKSESNSVYKKPTISTKGDSFLNEECSLNCKIDGQDIGNNVKIVNNISCELQHDLAKKPVALDDINSFLDLELSIECNNVFHSTAHVKANVTNSSNIEDTNIITENCKPNCSKHDCLLNKSSNKGNIHLDSVVTNKIIQDDDLDVVSPHSFETFTVIKKNNETENIFSKYNNDENYQHDPSKSESNSFQTFTVINQNVIIDNPEKDIIVNSESFEPETSNDYKTFTVVNGINESSLKAEQQCGSSSSLLSNSKTFTNSNNVIDINISPLTHSVSQFDTITLLSNSNNLNNSIKEEKDLSKNVNNDRKDCNLHNFDIGATNKEHSEHNESQFDTISLLPDSSNHKKEEIDELKTLKNDNNDYNTSNFDIISTNKRNLGHNESQFDTITLLPESNNLRNEVNDLSKSLNNDENNYKTTKLGVVSTNKVNSPHDYYNNKINLKTEENTIKEITNNCESLVKSEDSTLCTNIKPCSDVVSNALCSTGNITPLNCVSENSNSQCSNNLSSQHVEKLNSSGESDSTLSLHLEILENNKGLNSPDSLNEDEVFVEEEIKPIVSNKLEFVPLESTPLKDNRSPRLSRKYMECSPVISANSYVPELEKSPTVEENKERKNSSSFFIDFNQGTPKSKPKRFESLTKSLDSSTITNSKEKIFSMFIDFNEDSESSESSSKGTKYRKPQTLADRFVRMHSEETNVKSIDREDTVTPPPSRMTSTVENSSVDISESCKKQSVFMFIENDSPAPVKRRTLPQSSRLKSQRNSWNVDSTNTNVHKTHHRTHSVNLSDESHLDSRMTQSHIETGSNEFNKPLNSFDSVECNVKITVNGTKDGGIGLTDSFVRLSDMDKAPSQEIMNSLNRSESKSESLRRDLKNTELGKCLKRMFPYLKSTEVERILLSKPPHSLDNREVIKTGLGQDLLRMFLEEIGADTTIDVNGRRIKAHKCVLTSRCQYFAAMFSGGWVQSAGNVLYLKGFSYNTVHLTLRYIYSGECNFSEIKNVAELSKLADMLCLEGLKDNIMLYLAAEYCHFFKEVCERCTIGILECLTLSVAYGLDDLYLSCIVWINDNFSVVWPTNHFVSLPQDLKVKCFKHKVAHIDDLNDVLSVTEGCEKIKKLLPNDEWAKEIIELTTDLSNSVIKYLAKSFYSTITSKYFKQILESENLFANSFATHLLASCNCANRNQIRQAFDHLNKSSSNHFWHAQGEILVNAIMELIVKGLASDFKNGRERQAMGSLPNDYRMSESLAKRIAFELGVPGIELAANGTLITSSPVKKMTTSSRSLNKTPEHKTKQKTIENITISKTKAHGKFAEVKSRYMEPKPQVIASTPQRATSVHKDLPRGRRIMSSSMSLTSSPNVRNTTIPSSRLTTNHRVDTGLKTKTSSELSLSTPKFKPRTVMPKTDPLPNTRTSCVASKTTPKTTRKSVQNNVGSRKMANEKTEKTLSGAKKQQTVIPKTKSLPNGHPTIGSRSGTFCKDEPTVIHSKDITS